MPLHVRDLLATNDGNYRPLQQEQQDQVEDGDSGPDQEDTNDMSQHEVFDTTEESSKPRSPRRGGPAPVRQSPTVEAAGSPSRRPYSGISPGITPHVISSSDNSPYSLHRRSGNTAV